MNDDRRKTIQATLAKIAECKEELESAQSEEQEYFDAMPEGFQAGEKGGKATEAIDALQTAVDSLEQIDSDIEAVL